MDSGILGYLFFKLLGPSASEDCQQGFCGEAAGG